MSRCAATSRCISPSSCRREDSARTRERNTRSLVHIALPRVREAEQPPDDAGDPMPVLGFGGQLLPAGFGDRVELRLAVVVGRAPARGDPAPLLQAKQRCVNGPLVELQHVVAYLLDAPRDAIPMQRP